MLFRISIAIIYNTNFYRDLDFQIRPLENQSRYQANIDDITLPMIDGFQQFGDIGPSDGLGSQDFEGGDLDLELDFGNEQQGEGRDDAMSLTGSVGVGRDAAPSRMSVDSYILGGDKDEDFFSQRGQSRGLSEQPNGMDMQVDADPFGEIDLGDIGIGFGDQDQMDVDGNKTPGLSRACKPRSLSSSTRDLPLRSLASYRRSSHPCT